MALQWITVDFFSDCTPVDRFDQNTMAFEANNDGQVLDRVLGIIAPKSDDAGTTEITHKNVSVNSTAQRSWR